MTPDSVEVMRLDWGVAELKWPDIPSFHGNHAILVLQNASYKQKGMMDNDAMVFLEKLGRDDHIGDARFIFEA